MNSEPYDKVLDQIAELLQMAYDNAQKPIPIELQADLNAKLESLQKQMQILAEKSDKFAEGAGVSEYTMQAMLEDDKAKSLSKILKRAQDLKLEAMAASQDVQKAANSAKASGKHLNKNKEKVAKSRKGKFRSMGGVKNWKAL